MLHETIIVSERGQFWIFLPLQCSCKSLFIYRRHQISIEIASRLCSTSSRDSERGGLPSTDNKQYRTSELVLESIAQVVETSSPSALNNDLRRCVPSKEPKKLLVHNEKKSPKVSKASNASLKPTLECHNRKIPSLVQATGPPFRHQTVKAKMLSFSVL